MKNNKKLALAAATFGIAALAMGGSTFAWFQVVNTANLALQGTIVGVDNRLQVGFRVANEIATASALGLTQDAESTALESGDHVYWAPNSVTASVMDAIIAANDFATDNELTPITSGSFVAGDAIDTFYERPAFDANRTNAIYPLDATTDKLDHVGFSIIFKALDEEDLPVEAVNIYFDSVTTVNASAGTDALRVAFDNGTTSRIIKPSAVATGETEVGGVMDLNGDGVNDYTLQTYVLGEPQPVYEIAYGEFDESLVVPTNWETSSSGTAVAEPYSNTQFNAGATGVGVLALETATPKTAAYTYFGAYYEAGTALASTDASGIAEIDFRVWLEGWDDAAVNSIANATVGAAFAFVSSI